jgi:serine/threonine protein kinase
MSDEQQQPQDDETEHNDSPAPVGPPQDELIGQMMGQYEVKDEIGRGGMATVYRAVQQSMNRVVALKVLPRQMLHDPTFYDRFLREVEVISHLEHPHILPIYDYGQSDNLPFIAMRYLGGGSLDQRVRKGRMTPEEIEQPLRQVARALDHAHQQGIIHRDLKPGNIMLDDAGNAYLSDFGIARVLGSDMTGSMIIGTPAYMSPEQANGLPIDARSDIYSTGIVLFELLTGRGPFQAETPMAVLLKHITEPLPPMSDYVQGIPYAVEQVIKKATAKNPDDRYSSAGELAEAYSAALHDDHTDQHPPLNKESPGSPAVPGNVTGSMTEPAISAPTPPAQGSPITAPVRASEATTEPKRPPLPLVALVIVLLVAAGGVIAVLLTQNADNSSGPPPVAMIPTPFPRASTITEPEYTISMPDEWIPPEIKIDQSESNRLRHLWRSDEADAYVALTLFTPQANAADRPLSALAENYISTQYSERLAFDFFIDEDTAEDGTLRRSYRIPLIEDGNNAAFDQLDTPGQLDVFLREDNSGQIVLLEFYTADSTGNRLVPRLQFILDSLRIRDV